MCCMHFAVEHGCVRHAYDGPQLVPVVVVGLHDELSIAGDDDAGDCTKRTLALDDFYEFRQVNKRP